jgi:outer membrane protein assembly factor BamB
MQKQKTTGIMRSLAILTICLVLFQANTIPTIEQASFNTSENTDSVQAYNTKLLSLYKEIYANPALQPSYSFNQGHVAGAGLRDYLHKTDFGYMIQLPGNTLVPSPVVYEGKVYLSGGFGSKRYYAFDAATGEHMVAWDLDDDGPSSAAIHDDILVFNTESCTIFAIDIKTGKQLWSWWLGDPLMCMPTISRGRVFAAYPAGFNHSFDQSFQDRQLPDSIKQEYFNLYAGLSHVLAAFDLKTGEILWQRWIDADIMSAPVADGGKVYVTTFAGTLYTFSQSDGELLSVNAMRATSAPVITEDGIYVSKRADGKGERVAEELARFRQNSFLADKKYNKKYAPYLDKDVQQGSELKSKSMEMDAGNGFVGGAPVSSGWQKANDVVGQSNVSSLQSFQGSRSLHYMDKNYSTMGNELICSDPESGKKIWKIKLEGQTEINGGFMGTPPLEAGGYIVIATYNGLIKVLDAKTGEPVKEYDIENTIRYQPVVDKGWIYVTTTNSKMFAICTGMNKLTGWPMWGGNAERTNKSMQ